MSADTPAADTTQFLSDDSEAVSTEEEEDAVQGEELSSGVSPLRAVLTVLILCFVNLLNYMDRFTIAGTRARTHAQLRACVHQAHPDDVIHPTGVLPDIERYFGIDDSKSGLLQTGENTCTSMSNMAAAFRHGRVYE